MKTTQSTYTGPRKSAHPIARISKRACKLHVYDDERLEGIEMCAPHITLYKYICAELSRTKALARSQVRPGR